MVGTSVDSQETAVATRLFLAALLEAVGGTPTSLAERFVPRIAGVQYRLVPNSVGGKGHGTHTWAVFWKQDLVALLARSEP